jgi:hypothetical protein
MNTATYDRSNPVPAGVPPDDGRVPARARRRYLTWWTVLLCALVACAAGFYAGVRIEKGQVSGSGSSGSAGASLAALTSRFRSAAGAGTTSGAPGATAGTRGGAGGAGGAAGAAGAAGGSFGTITSIRGSAFYMTDATGNTVKVTLSSATKLTKSLGVKRSSLHPGDTVIIRGITNSSGTLVAASVSDSGASATRTGGSGSSGSGSGSGGGLSSLFSAGG